MIIFVLLLQGYLANLAGTSQRQSVLNDLHMDYTLCELFTDNFLIPNWLCSCLTGSCEDTPQGFPLIQGHLGNIPHSNVHMIENKRESKLIEKSSNVTISKSGKKKPKNFGVIPYGIGLFLPKHPSMIIKKIIKIKQYID